MQNERQPRNSAQVRLDHLTDEHLLSREAFASGVTVSAHPAFPGAGQPPQPQQQPPQHPPAAFPVSSAGFPTSPVAAAAAAAAVNHRFLTHLMTASCASVGAGVGAAVGGVGAPVPNVLHNNDIDDGELGM